MFWNVWTLIIYFNDSTNNLSIRVNQFIYEPGTHLFRIHFFCFFVFSWFSSRFLMLSLLPNRRVFYYVGKKTNFQVIYLFINHLNWLILFQTQAIFQISWLIEHMFSSPYLSCSLVIQLMRVICIFVPADFPMVLAVNTWGGFNFMCRNKILLRNNGKLIAARNLCDVIQ